MDSPADLNVLRTERQIHRALAHPALSVWLKETLRSAMACEPLRLGNDLELLMHLLGPWAEARIAQDQSTARTCAMQRP